VRTAQPARSRDQPRERSSGRASCEPPRERRPAARHSAQRGRQEGERGSRRGRADLAAELPGRVDLCACARTCVEPRWTQRRGGIEALQARTLVERRDANGERDDLGLGSCQVLLQPTHLLEQLAVLPSAAAAVSGCACDAVRRATHPVLRVVALGSERHLLLQRARVDLQQRALFVVQRGDDAVQLAQLRSVRISRRGGSAVEGASRRWWRFTLLSSSRSLDSVRVRSLSSSRRSGSADRARERPDRGGAASARTSTPCGLTQHVDLAVLALGLALQVQHAALQLIDYLLCARGDVGSQRRGAPPRRNSTEKDRRSLEQRVRTFAECLRGVARIAVTLQRLVLPQALAQRRHELRLGGALDGRRLRHGGRGGLRGRRRSSGLRLHMDNVAGARAVVRLCATHVREHAVVTLRCAPSSAIDMNVRAAAANTFIRLSAGTHPQRPRRR
jgi:hypothetical protein